MNGIGWRGKEGTFSQKLGIIFLVSIGVVFMLMLFSPMEKPAYAAEGGSSSFTPGAQGDFAMCYYPPGLYFKENIAYTEGTLSKYPAGIQSTEAGPVALYAKLDSKVWFDLVQIVYSSDLKILGGHYFANINIPFVFDSDLKAKVSIPAVPAAGIVAKDKHSTNGLGDIQVVPAGIVWDVNDFHLLLAQNFVLTSGRFSTDPGELTNTGRNYFSYDELFGFTWLDQKGGHEASFIAGYMFNTKNQATGYHTGDEFHIDYTLAQYLSEKLGFAVVGYYYQQTTDDKSPLLDEIDAVNKADKAFGLPAPSGPDGFKSKGAAVGPAIMFSPKKNVNLIAKWLHEYYSRNRMEGEWVWLAAVVKF